MKEVRILTELEHGFREIGIQDSVVVGQLRQGALWYEEADLGFRSDARGGAQPDVVAGGELDVWRFSGGEDQFLWMKRVFLPQAYWEGKDLLWRVYWMAPEGAAGQVVWNLNSRVTRVGDRLVGRGQVRSKDVEALGRLQGKAMMFATTMPVSLPHKDLKRGSVVTGKVWRMGAGGRDTIKGDVFLVRSTILVPVNTVGDEVDGK